MRTISLILPAMPKFLKDLASQFRWRKNYLLLTPRFKVIPEYQGVLQEDHGHQRVMHVHVAIVGTYYNRVVYTGHVPALQDKYTTAHEWISDKFTIIKVGNEDFILHSWPNLKIRPFPDEEFHMVLTFKYGHTVKIPYFPTKL